MFPYPSSKYEGEIPDLNRFHQFLPGGSAEADHLLRPACLQPVWEDEILPETVPTSGNRIQGLLQPLQMLQDQGERNLPSQISTALSRFQAA